MDEKDIPSQASKLTCMKFKEAQIEEPKRLGSSISFKLVSQVPFGSSICGASLNFMQVSLLVRGYLYHPMSKSKFFLSLFHMIF
jgi:hypothetical protein